MLATSLKVRNSSARPEGRARIETWGHATRAIQFTVAPDLKVGRGLKPRQRAGWEPGDKVAPDLKVGRGLKPASPSGQEGLPA